MFLILWDQIQANIVSGSISLATFCLALLTGFTVHEFSHALSANQLGDPTAKRLGRLSLHPKAHLDPLGLGLLLLAGFGWAKPVPITSEYLRIGARKGMAVVAMAGPLSNIIVASIAAIPINVGLIELKCLGPGCEPIGSLVGFFLASLIFWNLLLASFNLIPLVPLDGFKILLGILPKRPSAIFSKLERYGPAPLFTLIMLGLLVPDINLFTAILNPVISELSEVILW